MVALKHPPPQDSAVDITGILFLQKFSSVYLPGIVFPSQVPQGPKHNMQILPSTHQQYK